MPKPLVTVLVDTFNHERFIEEALSSVLAQDFPRDSMEILVVDDGSSDRTPDLVRKFQPRVRLLRKPNGGQASAFNAGIPQAQGEIVAFLDGDDWWAPAKLSRVVGAMSADPSLAIVGHGILIVHLDGREQSEILRDGFQFRAATPDGARLFRLRRSFLGTSRMTIRAEILRRIGPVPEEIKVQADEYLFTLAAALAPARILPEPLAYYRFHDANRFQFAAADPARLRNLQSSMDALAKNLANAFERLTFDPIAKRAILEIVRAEAARTRLTVDGGWPWETLAAEWKIFEVTNGGASLPRGLLKILSLLPALAIPPKTYYRLRTRFAASDFYARSRPRWLPAHRLAHVQQDWNDAAGKHTAISDRVSH